MTLSSHRFLRSRLKTRHLILLVELGRHGSILHAAEAAGLTQPGASKLLSELEDTLGVTLFERLPRGVAPTWYGEVMIRRAGAALAEMEAAHQEVVLGAAGVGGRVNLGTVMTPSTGLVPAAVQLLKSRHTQVQVSLGVDTSKVLIERLRSGEIDIAIGRILDPNLVQELNFEPLAEEVHRLVVRAGHPWLSRSELTVEELAEAPWILPPAGMLRDRLTAMFISHGVREPVDSIETMALSMIPLLLMGSDRVVALPEELVLPYLEFGTLAILPVPLDIRLDCYGIVTRRQHHLAPAAEAMMQALRECARQGQRHA
ncbi:LysR substrate-binding domain-containing protein [Massilia endophytica]|uniref:LysR substrate-binding domain-containing protein n=1 Tax=Massilia endophytica TaxID=2899220 RepID=UPI001E3E2B2B|nr:LysR substrate-binding domain-containing protein [Massilia endophytica]UGQ49155.1 LysR substrate-binding domain-containing protein [Massilia endophytica]